MSRFRGLAVYSRADAERNRSFFDLLQRAAARRDIELSLHLLEDSAIPHADFALFRARDSAAAALFEQRGMQVFNRAAVNAIANDKSKASAFAKLQGIPSVPTRAFQAGGDLPPFLTEEGLAIGRVRFPYPLVLKPAAGFGGTGVERVDSVADARAYACSRPAGQPLVAQPYIECGAEDVRVWMIGQEPVGAVKRSGVDGALRSNYTRGGSAAPYALDPLERAQAVRLATALRSDYIALDFLLPKSGGWLFNEMEDPAGARSLYATGGPDIADLLLSHIERALFEAERRCL